MCGAMAHVLCEYQYVLNEYVKWISPEEDVTRVMSHLCFRRKLDVVKILPTKTVCNSGTTEGSHRQLGRIYCVLSKMKADCS